MVLRRLRVLRNNLVLSTKLIVLIGHRKGFLKLALPTLAPRQSELRLVNA